MWFIDGCCADLSNLTDVLYWTDTIEITSFHNNSCIEKSLLNLKSQIRIKENQLVIYNVHFAMLILHISSNNLNIV
jgi:hypothetical protein